MAKAPTPGRGEIWRIDFDPAVGTEIRKARPAVVMSIDSVGRLPLRIVVPITDWKPVMLLILGSSNCFVRWNTMIAGQ